MEEINCKRCIHYFITWDPTRPNGCKIFSFKSQKMPSRILKECGEKKCGSFMAKTELNKKKESEFLRDDWW